MDAVNTWETEATRLAGRARSGNAEAFDALYGLIAERALRTAAGILLNAGDAADAVQETFLRVWRSFLQYRPAEPFAPWFYRILINECRRIMAKRRPCEDIDAMQEPSAPDSGFTAVEIRLALARLPERQRTAVSLKYLSGLTEKEVAALMQTTASAVKSLLKRGRDTLEEGLER